LRPGASEHPQVEERGQLVDVRARARVFRIALLAAILVAIVVVTSASGRRSACTAGASSIGPAVVVNGQLDAAESDLTPQTEACLPD
jgi:hypothetical protein